MSFVKAGTQPTSQRLINGLCADLRRTTLTSTVARQGASRRQQRWASTASEAASSSSASAADEVSPLAPRFMPGSVPKALPSRLKPASPSFYTAKPAFVDSIILLEDLTRRTKRSLEQNSIPVNSPDTQYGINAARRSVAWPKVEEMGNRIGITLKSSQYRHIVARLSALLRYRYFLQEYFAKGAYGEENRRLAVEVEETLQRFNRISAADAAQTDVHHSRFLSSSSGVDSLGRAYARGRRKESSARVWLVPAKDVEETQGSAPLSTISTSILINAQTISTYFTRASDREAILFPLRLTGLAGVFNIFALVRGGGTTGQTGAVAHGIARALIVYFDDKARTVEDREGLSSPLARPLRVQANNIRNLLVRTGASLRDPRAVERKKTGKAKSRKAYTWVKR